MSKATLVVVAAILMWLGGFFIGRGTVSHKSAQPAGATSAESRPRVSLCDAEMHDLPSAEDMQDAQRKTGLTRQGQVVACLRCGKRFEWWLTQWITPGTAPAHDAELTRDMKHIDAEDQAKETAALLRVAEWEVRAKKARSR